MLRLIYSKDDAARLDRADEIIIELCKDEKRCFLIVPETSVLAAEKRIFPRVAAKANLFFEVLSFRRLPDRLHRTAGGIKTEPLSDGDRAVLTSLALFETGAYLKRYGADMHKKGNFVLKMADCIAKLKASSIGAEKLSDAAARAGEGALSEKLSDISAVYSAYEALLSGGGISDDGGRMDYVIEKLGECEFFKGSTVVIDGFVGYTPKEYAIIGKALSQADDVYITVPCSAKADTGIYEKPIAAAEELKREAARASVGVALPEQPEAFPCADEELSKIKDGLWDGEKKPKIKDEKDGANVRLVGCDGKAGESEAAAMLALALCAEEGYEMRDIAVCTADAASYTGIIDTVFERHGIPLYMSVKYDFASTPLYRLITASLSAVQNGFMLSDMLAIIKTSLTNAEKTDADELCFYAETWNISGSAWTSEREFENNPDGFTKRTSDRAKTILERSNRAKPLIAEPLVTLGEKFKAASTVRDFAAALFEYAEELNIEKKEKQNAEFFESRGEYYLSSCTKQLWEQLCGALDRLVKLCGDRTADAHTFSFLLDLELKSLHLAAIPGSVDEVQMIPASSLSGCTPKALIVLGANEGIFPEPPAEDAFFTKEELDMFEALGINRGVDALDYGCEPLRCFQSAVSLPSEKLYVLRDSSLEPSIGYTRIKNITGIREEDSSNLDAYGASAAADLYAYTKDEELGASIRENEPDTYAAFGAQLDASDARISEATAKKIIKNRYNLSPTAKEEYKQCMLRGWGGRVFRLREEKEASKLELNDSGTFYHLVFEKFVLEMINSHQAASSITRGEIKDRLERCIAEYVRDYLHGLDDKSARFRYLFERMKSTLEMFLCHLVDDYAQSKFVPWKTEYKIGENGETEGLCVSVGEGMEIMLTGSADRVDIYKKDGKAYVRVGDYKSGGKEFKLKDVEKGYSHQMLAYLYSICKEGARDEEGCELAYGGVVYYSAKRPKLKSAGVDALTAPDEEDIKNGFETRGLLISDIDILEAMESELEGKFIPYKKGGRSKTTASVDEFEQYKQIIVDSMKELGRELYAGNISARPDPDSKDACKYCKFGMLCRCEKPSYEY